MIKYYKKMIQARNWELLFRMIFFVFLGSGVIFIGLQELKEQGMYPEFSTHLVPKGILLEGTLIYFLLGVFALFMALVWFPMWEQVDVQDLTEYQVSSDEKRISVKYRKYEWNLERSRFNSMSFFWFDSNHTFITYTKGRQVYFTVKECFSDKIAISIPGEFMEENAIRSFSNQQLVSEEEKENYIKKFHLNNKRWGMKLISLFFLLIALRVIILEIAGYAQKNMVQNIGTFVISFLLFLAGRAMFKRSTKEQKESKWIKSHELYKVQAACYEKLGIADGSGKYRFVRIGDGESIFIKKKFSMLPEEYRQITNDVVYVYYYIDPEGECKIRITASVLKI